MQIKVVATLGPASMNRATMLSMAQNGVRIFRFNFSHSNAASFVDAVKWVREIENEIGKPLTAMGDLCGPKDRIGVLKTSPALVRSGDRLLLGLPGEDRGGDELFIPLDMPQLLKGLSPGMPVVMADGLLRMTVSETLKADRLYALTAHTEAVITSHKGVAFPGKFHPMPALTEKDKVDLHEGLDIGIDAFALSFVQNKDDVISIKDEIARRGIWVPVVSKLERRNAVDNLDSILALSDAVMVARGDLGLECPLPELPILQKRIIRAARHAQKGVIVATQMLLSMVNNPIPTRAETTDVANAVMDGADCVMLSEETAVGKYPVEAVGYIAGIADQAVGYMLERIEGPYAPKREKNPAKYLAYAATLLADNTDAKAIVCHSTSGASARLLSSRRPAQPIFALTPDPKILRWLNFFYGVSPRLADVSVPTHLGRVERFVETSGNFAPGDAVILTSGQPTPGQKAALDLGESPLTTNLMKIYYKG